MFFPEGGGYEPYSYNQGSANAAESFDTYVSGHVQLNSAYGAQLKPGERFNNKDIDVKKQGPMLKNALGPAAGSVKSRLIRD